MADTFAISEVLELAVQIEINGKDFYNAVAKKAKTDAPEGAYPEEYFAYIRALAEGKVFAQKNKGKETAKNVKNEKEALDLGINAEKFSILFYEGMKKLVPGEDNKMIDVVIDEEKDHLRQLVELKAVI